MLSFSLLKICHYLTHLDSKIQLFTLKSTSFWSLLVRYECNPWRRIHSRSMFYFQLETHTILHLYNYVTSFTLKTSPILLLYPSVWCLYTGSLYRGGLYTGYWYTRVLYTGCLYTGCLFSPVLYTRQDISEYHVYIVPLTKQVLYYQPAH